MTRRAPPPEQPRCWWSTTAPDYQRYHDEEWGMPVGDDTRLFEKLCLEGFQSGLSWLTILRKRDAFRRAFGEFHIERVARFKAHSIPRLLGNAAIVRHRGKIESTINNARRALEVIEQFGSLAHYFWRFEPPRAARPSRITRATLERMTQTPESVALSRDLKQRGFTYVGPTTVYAFMQAMGLVNDHVEDCFVRERVRQARKRFPRPR